MNNPSISLALRICYGVAVVLLGLTVYSGLSDAPGVLRAPENARQVVVGVAQLVFVAAALATLVGLALRASWSVGAAIVWAAATTTTATFASVAWDTSGGVFAVLGALLGSGVATGLVVWCIRRFLRAAAG